MIDNIEYKDYKKKSDIHGTVLYPAVMVAPLQKAILAKLLTQNDNKVIFDPFHGSGTSLYESAELSDNVRIVGCDINPLANLITKVKLSGVSECFEQDFSLLKSNIAGLEKGDDYTFPKIEKWFKPEISESLKLLRTAIKKIPNKQNRLFFWYMLCDIVRRYSNTRSSTYKLHKRTDEDILKLQNKVISDYLSSIEKSVSKFKKNYTDFTLYKCDVKELINSFEDRVFDITITSPPYGDNNTTVPYGGFSMLPLHWIDSDDLQLEGWEFENFSIIDSKSIGGRYSQGMLSDMEYELIKEYLDQISLNKQKKVVRFFADYFEVLREICRVTDKNIVITLGNRTVDRVRINLTRVTETFIVQNGFNHIGTYEREIRNKRTPRRTSRIENEPVESMNTEFVSIYSRE